MVQRTQELHLADEPHALIAARDLQGLDPHLAADPHLYLTVKVTAPVLDLTRPAVRKALDVSLDELLVPTDVWDDEMDKGIWAVTHQLGELSREAEELRGDRSPCSGVRDDAILVSIIRSRGLSRGLVRAPGRRRKQLPGHWLLQDAKARFSELVRRVRTEGPQHVTVHGRDEVVVISVEEFRRLKGDRTGAALISAMQASPFRDVDIEPGRDRMQVRDVFL